MDTDSITGMIREYERLRDEHSALRACLTELIQGECQRLLDENGKLAERIQRIEIERSKGDPQARAEHVWQDTAETMHARAAHTPRGDRR